MLGQEWLAKIKLVLEGKDQVVSGLGQTSTAAKTAFSAVNTEAKKSINQMGDLEKAIRRAFIVAPVWMAARAVLQQVNYFISEGIQYYLATEKAILNVKSSLQLMGDTGAGAIDSLTKRFHSLSLATGQAEASIANTYANVNRILGDTEKSYLATNAAVKLGEATGADAAKIAESLAYLYKAQGDTIKGAATEEGKFLNLQIMLYAAQAKIPGGIEKLSSELMAGIPIMKEANISIEDFIKLTIALNQSGITTSQTLKTGLMRVLTNLPDITKQLNIPATTKPFDVLLIALERMSTLYKSGDLTGFGSAVKEIFGGIRGGQFATIATDIDKLKISLEKPIVNERSLLLYNDQLKAIDESAGHQIEFFQNLKKQAGDAFITALLGGKNFDDAMKNANITLANGMGLLENFGKLANSISNIWKKTSLLGGVMGMTDELNKVTKSLEKYQDLQKRITLGLKGQLTAEETFALAEEVEKTRISNRDRFVKQLREEAAQLADNAYMEEKANKQSSEGDILKKKQIGEIDKLQKQSAKEKEKIIKKDNEDLIRYIDEVGKLEGLDQSKIIRQQIAYRNLLGGENSLIKIQEDRLKLAEALTKEEEKQEQKSAHIVDLYKIARQYGMQVAQEVSQFIGGAKELERLTPEAQRAVRRYQPGLYEESKAAQFFGGGMFGGGTGFQFPEQIQEDRRARRAQQIMNQVNVEPIQMSLTVDIDSERIIQKMKDAINGELDKKESELTTKINNVIEEL